MATSSSSEQPVSCHRLSAEELLRAIRTEFDLLNETHLGGKFQCPELVISKRKSYGGYYQPRLHRIVLSWQAYQEHGWEETVNTFRHEVAHLVHLNHSKAFWELARQLGITHRYAKLPLHTRKSAKYVYACPVCEHRLYRHRRLREASCGRCDKNYNPRFTLKLVKADS